MFFSCTSFALAFASIFCLLVTFCCRFVLVGFICFAFLHLYDKCVVEICFYFGLSFFILFRLTFWFGMFLQFVIVFTFGAFCKCFENVLVLLWCFFLHYVFVLYVFVMFCANVALRVFVYVCLCLFSFILLLCVLRFLSFIIPCLCIRLLCLGLGCAFPRDLVIMSLCRCLDFFRIFDVFEVDDLRVLVLSTFWMFML